MPLSPVTGRLACFAGCAGLREPGDLLVDDAPDVQIGVEVRVAALAAALETYSGAASPCVGSGAKLPGVEEQEQDSRPSPLDQFRA